MNFPLECNEIQIFTGQCQVHLIRPSLLSIPLNLGKGSNTVEIIYVRTEVVGVTSNEITPTSLVTYSVRNGRYKQNCRWKKTRRGIWRCIQNWNLTTIEAGVLETRGQGRQLFSTCLISLVRFLNTNKVWILFLLM